MIDKIIASVVVGLITIGLIKYLVPYLGSVSEPATFVVALIGIIIILLILAGNIAVSPFWRKE